MKTGAHNHVKTKRLKRVLGIPQYAAVGILESLWQATAECADEGDIGKYSNEDIAAQLEWEGDAHKLIEGLIASGFLDEDPDKRLTVHDWSDHCPDFVKDRWRKRDARARKRNKRTYGKKSPDSPVKEVDETPGTKDSPATLPERTVYAQPNPTQPNQSARAADSDEEPPEGNSKPPPPSKPFRLPRSSTIDLIRWWTADVLPVCPELPGVDSHQASAVRTAWSRVSDHPSFSNWDKLAIALKTATWWRTQRPTWGLLALLAIDSDGPRAAKLLAGAYADGADPESEKAAAVTKASDVAARKEAKYRERLEADRRQAEADAEADLALESELGPEFDALPEEDQAGLRDEVLAGNPLWKKMQRKPMVAALIRQECLRLLREGQRDD